MSVNNAKQFIEDGKSNQKLRESVNAQLSGLSGDEMVSAVVKAGGVNGYTFSAEDYKNAAKDLLNTLSPDQLNKVAGGASAVILKGTGSAGETEWLAIAGW